MKTDKIQDVFCTLICDAHSAEEQLKNELPSIVDNVKNPELAAALEKFCKQTEGQIERLESVYDMMDLKAKDRKCEAMAGYIEELNIMIDGAEEGPLRDIGVVAYGKKIGHHMIASYEALANLAEGMGNSGAAQQIKLNLQEVKDAEAQICSLGRKSVGPDAIRMAA